LENKGEKKIDKIIEKKLVSSPTIFSHRDAEEYPF
jgi:hypothetical protein